MNAAPPLKDIIVSLSDANSAIRDEIKTEASTDTVNFEKQRQYERRKKHPSDNSNGNYHNNVSPRRQNSHVGRYNRSQNQNHRQVISSNRNGLHNYVNNNTKSHHHLDTNNNNNNNGNSNTSLQQHHQQQQQQHQQIQKQSHGNYGNQNGYNKTQNEYQDGKKQLNRNPRIVTKSSQTGGSNHEQQYNSMRTEKNGGVGDVLSHPSAGLLSHPEDRKYSTDYLSNVGYKVVPTQHAQKFPEDAMMQVKMALGDNSKYYNHLYYTSNPVVYQQQIQNYACYQQQQIQQRMQMYGPRQQQQQSQQQIDQGNYNQRVAAHHSQSSIGRTYSANSGGGGGGNNNNSNNSAKESDSRHTQQPQQQSHDVLVYSFYQHQSNQQSASYQNQNNQNRGKSHSYRERKNRNQSSNSTGNDRYHGNNGKTSSNNNNNKSPNDQGQRLIQTRSETNIQQDDQYKNQRKNFMSARTNSDEYKYHRSLSPTPPSSVKSASPKPIEKTSIEFAKDSTEIADDSESTASASSGPSALSYSSEHGKEIASIVEPALLMINNVNKDNNVNSWINNNNFSVLHNGLSASAEELNVRSLEASVSAIKRPPSVIEITTNSHYHSIPRNLSLTQPTYNPVQPFEYYISHSDFAEMRSEPENLKCGSVWDAVSKQMWDKFQMHQQTRETYRSKIQLWQELYEYVKGFRFFQQRAYPRWGLFLVGSTISGFGLDRSDVDMCLVFKSPPQYDPRTEAMITLSYLKTYLSDSTFQGFSLINAKVPILRFRDVTNTIEVDLNYNNCIGVRNTHMLHCYAQLDWRLRPLAIVVKLWAQFHNINDARNSTISSYSLVLMVIHFLQCAMSPPVLPCLHQMCPDKFQVLHDITTIDILEKLDLEWKSENTQPLGELFLRFLDYYSNFNFSRNAISVRTGGVLLIEECKNVKSAKNDPNHWQTLCIEEPFDLTNTARSTYNGEIFEKIKNVFYRSWRQLKEFKSLDAVFREPIFVQQQQSSQQYHPPPQNSQSSSKFLAFPSKSMPTFLTSSINQEITS